MFVGVCQLELALKIVGIAGLSACHVERGWWANWFYRRLLEQQWALAWSHRHRTGNIVSLPESIWDLRLVSVFSHLQGGNLVELFAFDNIMEPYTLRILVGPRLLLLSHLFSHQLGKQVLALVGACSRRNREGVLISELWIILFH